MASGRFKNVRRCSASAQCAAGDKSLNLSLCPGSPEDSRHFRLICQFMLPFLGNQIVDLFAPKRHVLSGQTKDAKEQQENGANQAFRPKYADAKMKTGAFPNQSLPGGQWAVK
jgi:hypothetical protein